MTFTLGGKKSQFKEVLVLFVPTILLVGILEDTKLWRQH